MAVLLLALALLAALAFGIGWFLRANPSMLAKGLRRVLIVTGALGLGGVLLFSVRFLPELVPELLGLIGVAVIGFLTRWLRQHLSGGGFSTPDGKRRTEVRTAFLRAWIDHGTGDVGGAVMAGRFAGRTLDSLSDAELIDLHGESAADGDSARVLESYLDRRLGPNWQTAQSPPPRSRSDMSRDEALSVLGLAEGATADEIRAAHRRLIQRVHPDVGGSADLAARINRAKDILLGI